MCYDKDPKTKWVKINKWWSCCARNDYLFCGIYLLRFRTLGVVSHYDCGECGGKESLNQGSRRIKTFIKYEKSILQNPIWWSSCAQKDYFVVFTYCASGPWVSCPSLIIVNMEERNHLLKEVEQLKHQVWKAHSSKLNMMVLLCPKILLCGIYLLSFRTRTLGVMSQFNCGECGGKESLTQESRTIKTFIKCEKRVHQKSIWCSCCARKYDGVVLAYCPSGPGPRLRHMRRAIALARLCTRLKH